MTEGLACIALAAAHLEAEQKKRNQEAPFNFSQNSRSGVVPLSSLPRPLSKDARAISNAVAEASDEDPITDAEETLALILAAQPKDIPPPPAPDEAITKVLPDDVLCGRGGETNHHHGNVQYRGLVKKYQRLYLKAKRRDKPKIARIIVNSVRCLNGRFLRKESDGVWKDVGNVKAREKTSQALREGAPEIRGHQGKRKGLDYAYPQPLQPYLLGVHLVSPTSSSASLPTTEDFVAATYPPIYSAFGVMPATKKVKVEPSTPPKRKGGPRLKYLKFRLMHEDGCD